MSTTSPNFNFVLATTADPVNVVTQIANNFSTLDSVLAVAHTGTGAIKAGITLQSPVLQNPTVSGALTLASLTASTGVFTTITASAGKIIVNTFGIGTYLLPVAIGTTSQLLTVSGGNAVWLDATPNTGANQALSNLTTVAFNTSLNTFTGGLATLTRIIATSGAITGLTAFQATTGTFAGNLVVSGTATINVINCTGGTITAGGFTIGTYSYPATVGSTNQLMVVTTGNLIFQSAKGMVPIATFTAANAVNITVTGFNASAAHILTYVMAHATAASNGVLMEINAATMKGAVYGFLNGAFGTGTGSLFISASNSGFTQISLGSMNSGTCLGGVIFINPPIGVTGDMSNTIPVVRVEGHVGGTAPFQMGVSLQAASALTTIRFTGGGVNITGTAILYAMVGG